jgi:hypothetical protein
MGKGLEIIRASITSYVCSYPYMDKYAYFKPGKIIQLLLENYRAWHLKAAGIASLLS